MLKHIILITMSVFGAASIAVAGMPITMPLTHMTVRPESRASGAAATRTGPITVAPGLRRLEKPAVRAGKPASNIKVRGQRPGARFIGTRGMVSTGLRPVPPRLRVTRISSKIGKCPAQGKFVFQDQTLAIVSATIYNDGGPMPNPSDVTSVVSVHESGTDIGGSVRVPQLAHGQQAVVKFPVKLLSGHSILVGKLPGAHKLSIYLEDEAEHKAVISKVIASMKITFPPDYCQPKPGSVTHGNMPDLIDRKSVV